MCRHKPATMIGTDGDDNLRGGPGPDVIVGLGGADHISGLRKGDRACGGPGADLIDDISKPSKVSTLRFSDIRVSGGSGDDSVLAVWVKAVRAGAGNDRVEVTNAGGVVRLGLGDDRLLARGLGVYVIYAGGGDDLVAVNSVWLGARHHDCLHYNAVRHAMRIDLAAGTATGQGRDQLKNVHCVVTGAGDDVVRGTQLGDVLYLKGGQNTAFGRGGSDQISGSWLADLIFGGAGDDLLKGLAGNDRIYGGAGNDHAMGGLGADRLYGEEGDDTMVGGADSDYVDGRPDDDRATDAAGL